MQKTNEDCFYFLTSTCAKGSTCSYRHNPTVRTCNVICPAWSRGNCTDLTCSLRHSTIQRPVISSGITCLYENTPMGCLKPGCPFIHLRSRTNLRNSPTPRPSTTNLVNKDAIKPSPVITESVPTPVPPPAPKVETPPAPKTETPVTPIVEIPPAPKVEIPVVPKLETRPAPKVETPSISEKSPAVVKPVTVESNTRNFVVNSSEKSSDDREVPTRTVVNRSVVIGDSNRKVVQGNRVVVPSTTKTTQQDSDSDLDDLIEQENDTKRSNGSLDILFPCSAPSITNRLFMSAKSSPTTATTNDTKPIRLNRDRLPAPKISGPNSDSPTSNGEKTSAGIELLQDDDRRISRLERFKQKPKSPTRSVVAVSPNERKRPAPDQSDNDLLPAKRLSSEQDLNRHKNSTTTIGELCSPPTSPRRTQTHHRRRRRRSSPSPSPPPLQRKSPLRQTYSASSSMNDSTWKKEVDEFLAKTTQPKPVPLLSLRPRFVPPPVQRQPPPPPLMPRAQPRQPSTMPAKRPSAPVITPPEVSTKAPEPVAPTPTLTTINSKEEDENRLLGLNEPTDVVDTFALIDEVLLETDDFLELM